MLQSNQTKSKPNISSHAWCCRVMLPPVGGTASEATFVQERLARTDGFMQQMQGWTPKDSEEEWMDGDKAGQFER